MKTLSVKQSRAIDRIALEKYNIPTLILMENAGRSSYELIKELPLKCKKTILFIGPGNNGGDGLVLARHFANNGYEITLYLAKDPSCFAGDTLTNWNIIKNFPQIEILAEKEVNFNQYDLIVDALLGTGLSRNVTSPLSELIDSINQSGIPVVSLDIPSGLCGDTGKKLGVCVNATYTISMGITKQGIEQSSAAVYVGQNVIADISLPSTILSDLTL